MESFLISLVSFIIAIAILVSVHEYGHFWVARKLDVKVIRFSIGFGKILFKYTGKKDNTEYVIAALPLGGYVKMLGEEEEEVDPKEKHRAFSNKSVYERFAIVFAGPFFNFVFAVFAFFLMYLIGIQGVKPVLGSMEKTSIAWQSGFRTKDHITKIAGKEVRTFSSMYEKLLPAFIDRNNVIIEVNNRKNIELQLKLIPRSVEVAQMHESIGFELDLPKIKAVIGKVFSGTPAYLSGMMVDDRIISINSNKIDDWLSLVLYVKTRPNQQMQIILIRDNMQKTIDLVSKSELRNGKQVGVLGIANKYKPALTESMLIVDSYPPWESLIKGIEKTWDMSLLSLKMFGKMLIGEASLKNISGPITIAEVAGNSFQRGIEYFLRFLGIVSLSLGIINLLPIPVLDGGHLMFYAVEIIKGNPVSEKTQEFSLKIGVGILMMLMSLAIFNDISRLLL